MTRFFLIFLLLPCLLFAQSNINEDSIHFIGQASGFTVGANLVTNGDFSSWTGTNDVSEVPTGWTRRVDDTVNSHVREVGAGEFDGGAGTGAANIWTDDGTNTWLRPNDVLTIGKIYRATFDIWVNAGQINFRDTDFITLYASLNTSGHKVIYFKAVATGVYFFQATSLDDVTIDNIEIVEWVGDPDAGGGCTIASFTGDLLDYMTATGGVFSHGAALPLANNAGNVQVTGIDWDIAEPQVGTLVNMDFSAALDGLDDGIFTIIAVTENTMTIDGDSSGFSGKTVEYWVGGAFPDIATAINDSTLSEDFSGKYRKRSIVVNVPLSVDAVTDFVAETSETTLREHDGSRKIIAFYNSISVVQPGAGAGDYGYRVVSDMDFGQTYYAGARRAFNLDEGFTEINPNGKWGEWDANGNDINIIEMNTSNLEFRNLHIHNTAIGGTNALLHVDDADVFNHAFVNCWFATADLLLVNTAVQIERSIFQDCYFDDSIVSNQQSDIQFTAFINCITNGTGRTTAADGFSVRSWYNSLFYKGVKGVNLHSGGVVSNCVFFDQTTTGIALVTGDSRGTVYNSIFSPVAASDNAFNMTNGSLNAASRNNIMYSVTGGGVLTNPILHGQISPNPPLPVGTMEKDPLFVNPGDGDFRLQVDSPARAAGIGGVFGNDVTIGMYQFPQTQGRHRSVIRIGN